MPVIAVAAEALKDSYPEGKLKGLFVAAGVEIPSGAKMTKVELCMACLGWINKNMSDPLAILGGVIGEIMDRNAAADEQLAEHQRQVATALRNNNYNYARGGTITANGVRLMSSISKAITAGTDVPKRESTPRTSQRDAPVSSSPPSQAVVTEGKREQARARSRRPTLFIGSTVEALEIARAVHAELDHDIEVTIWNHGLFPVGTVTWSQLLVKAHELDFALLIFSGDDQIKSRGQDGLGVRDNVLVEYGLFAGVLGADRVFFMFNRDARPKLASDLAGVTPLTYADREDKSSRAAVSPAADEIRQTARRLGRRVVATR